MDLIREILQSKSQQFWAPNTNQSMFEDHFNCTRAKSCNNARYLLESLLTTHPITAKSIALNNSLCLWHKVFLIIHGTAWFT